MAPWSPPLAPPTPQRGTAPLRDPWFAVVLSHEGRVVYKEVVCCPGARRGERGEKRAVKRVGRREKEGEVREKSGRKRGKNKGRREKEGEGKRKRGRRVKDM